VEQVVSSYVNSSSLYTESTDSRPLGVGWCAQVFCLCICKSPHTQYKLFVPLWSVSRGYHCQLSCEQKVWTTGGENWREYRYCSMEILRWCVQLPWPQDNQSASMRYACVTTACSSDTIRDAPSPEDKQRWILYTVRDPALLPSGECGQDLIGLALPLHLFWFWGNRDESRTVIGTSLDTPAVLTL
jgi:hypothetical protein